MSAGWQVCSHRGIFLCNNVFKMRDVVPVSPQDYLLQQFESLLKIRVKNLHRNIKYQFVLIRIIDTGIIRNSTAYAACQDIYLIIQRRIIIPGSAERSKRCFDERQYSVVLLRDIPYIEEQADIRDLSGKNRVDKQCSADFSK